MKNIKVTLKQMLPKIHIGMAFLMYILVSIFLDYHSVPRSNAPLAILICVAIASIVIVYFVGQIVLNLILFFKSIGDIIREKQKIKS